MYLIKIKILISITYKKSLSEDFCYQSSAFFARYNYIKH